MTTFKEHLQRLVSALSTSSKTFRVLAVQLAGAAIALTGFALLLGTPAALVAGGAIAVIAAERQ